MPGFHDRRGLLHGPAPGDLWGGVHVGRTPGPARPGESAPEVAGERPGRDQVLRVSIGGLGYQLRSGDCQLSTQTGAKFHV